VRIPQVAFRLSQGTQLPAGEYRYQDQESRNPREPPRHDVTARFFYWCFLAGADTIPPYCTITEDVHPCRHLHSIRPTRIDEKSPPWPLSSPPSASASTAPTSPPARSTAAPWRRPPPPPPSPPPE